MFKAISDEDAIALGFDPNFARPEWLILTVLPVPPLAVRPLVEMGGAKSHDDITFQLATIIKVTHCAKTPFRAFARLLRWFTCTREDVQFSSFL